MIALGLAVATATASAQSAIDAYSVSQGDLKGTARFMSMAGAFGALGGDLSTLTQNPGGIGVYRSSDIGVTIDLNMQRAKTSPLGVGYGDVTKDQTKFYCNNFGYVGAVRLNNDVMPYFNWGASYTRAASFDRAYKGHFPALNGSLTNYVADFTSAEGWTQDALFQREGSGYNPYQDGAAPWTSILFYNNYLINVDGTGGYAGLYGNGAVGFGEYDVLEKGYVDEYSINFGGNITNTVYWGIGFGITDIDFKQMTYYSETFESGAVVPNHDATGVEGNGSGGYGLSSWKHINGTGFNLKLGVIVKPINELRLGFAVHTPTWYNFTQEGGAAVDYELSTGFYPTSINSWRTTTDEGYNDWFEWKGRTPWRLIASAAGVVGGRFIISGDYEYRPYQNMNIADRDGNNYELMNDDVKTYYQSTNIVRLGAEYRVTPSFSVRAGYSYESTPTTAEVKDNRVPVFTSGPDDTETTPSYSLDKSTQYITCGLGYRYKAFYADLAYVHKSRKSVYSGYTPLTYDGAYTGAPQAEVSNNDNSIILSVGFRF